MSGVRVSRNQKPAPTLLGFARGPLDMAMNGSSMDRRRGLPTLTSQITFSFFPEQIVQLTVTGA
jgi:hypothetical protein